MSINMHTMLTQYPFHDRVALNTTMGKIIIYPHDDWAYQHQESLAKVLASFWYLMNNRVHDVDFERIWISSKKDWISFALMLQEAWNQDISHTFWKQVIDISASLSLGKWFFKERKEHFEAWIRHENLSISIQFKGDFLREVDDPHVKPTAASSASEPPVINRSAEPITSHEIDENQILITQKQSEDSQESIEMLLDSISQEEREQSTSSSLMEETSDAQIDKPFDHAHEFLEDDQKQVTSIQDVDLTNPISFHLHERNPMQSINIENQVRETSMNPEDMAGSNTMYHSNSIESVFSTSYDIQLPLNPPVDVQVVAKNQSASISWSVEDTASGYMVYANGKKATSQPIQETHFELQSLVNFQPVAIEVCSVDGDAYSDKTEPMTVMPMLPPPEQARAIGGNRKVILAFSLVEHATHYALYREDIKVNAEPIIASPYILSGLTNGATYDQFNLRACDEHGESEALRIPSVSLELNPPMGLTAKAGNRMVKIEWFAENTASAYHVYVDGVKRTIDPILSTSYVIEGLKNQKPVHVSVSSVDGEYESNPCDAIVVTPFLPAPEIISIQPGNREVAISFQLVPHAIGYHVYDQDQKQNQELITTSPARIRGLSNGKRYAFRMTAVESEDLTSNPIVQNVSKPIETEITKTVEEDFYDESMMDTSDHDQEVFGPSVSDQTSHGQNTTPSQDTSSALTDVEMFLSQLTDEEREYWKEYQKQRQSELRSDHHA